MRTKRTIPDLIRIATILTISAAALMRADINVVGPDNTTQGSWNGKFGQDGFLIANGASSMPSYGTAAVIGAATYTWANHTSDVRAMQTNPGAATRIASTYYANNFNVNVSVNDGNLHPVSLYFLDWDTTSRSQTVTVIDAANNAVLDTQSITGFNGGKYFTWNVRGNLTININSTGGGSAVLSGIFFGLNLNAPPPSGGGGGSTSATPIGTDTSTQGAWMGKYGPEGYYVANGISQDPTYGSANVVGGATFTWAYNSKDPRGMQNSDPILGPIRTAATYYANTLNVNVAINDGKQHQVSLYFLDWDRSSPGQTVTVFDAATGAQLDTQNISGFGDGKYFSWKVKGNVRFSITASGYSSALVAGIFFGTGGTINNNPPNPSTSGSAATFVNQDAITQGTWTGKYGAAGYMIANGPSVTPSYANATVALNPYNFTWVNNTGDVRALQTSAGSTNRIASMYGTYKVSYFEFRITITDGNAHNISLYLLDWDSFARPETISVIDPSSGTVLDSRNFDGYHDGLWATWNIKGNVVIRVQPIGEIYGAVSGVFFN